MYIYSLLLHDIQFLFMRIQFLKTYLLMYLCENSVIKKLKLFTSEYTKNLRLI